ncbi:MAG: type II toxin-antitoxin system prevent-host-death family antitoxin [Thalassobaculaceae bacterium]|nr:type II toxin-antitoxin system prevent-host-death family antitoxin [Thalassobaculaceae bacterium]
MKEVATSEARACLSALLDAVERGEEIVITRKGKRIARIVPEARPRLSDLDRIVQQSRRLRERVILEDMNGKSHDE